MRNLVSPTITRRTQLDLMLGRKGFKAMTVRTSPCRLGLPVGAVAAGILFIAAMSFSPAPAEAQVIGGLDLVQACAVNHGGDGWWVPYLVSNDAFGWRCYNDQLRLHDNGFDMNAVCRTQYGLPAKAHAFNKNDPSSWVCEI